MARQQTSADIGAGVRGCIENSGIERWQSSALHFVGTSVQRPFTFYSKPSDSLWMQLVERAVHPHGHVQVVQAAVLADLVHHGGHAGAADLGGAARHGAAHLLHDDGVVARAVETQLLQDGPDLEQGQAVTGDTDTQRERRSSFHIRL